VFGNDVVWCGHDNGSHLYGDAWCLGDDVYADVQCWVVCQCSGVFCTVNEYGWWSWVVLDERDEWERNGDGNVCVCDDGCILRGFGW
jgi:hypothetical protein